MLDGETGLYHFRARAYSPSMGRFLQLDPAGFVDGMNRYQYAGGNPLAFTDPSGCAHGDDPWWKRYLVSAGVGGAFGSFIPGVGTAAGMVGGLVGQAVDDIFGDTIQDVATEGAKAIGISDENAAKVGVVSRWIGVGAISGKIISTNLPPPSSLLPFFRTPPPMARLAIAGGQRVLLPSIETAVAQPLVPALTGGTTSPFRHAASRGLVDLFGDNHGREVVDFDRMFAKDAGKTPRTGGTTPGGGSTRNAQLPNSVHGNSLNSDRLCTLYRLIDKTTGEFLEWGITQSPDKRYPAAEMIKYIMDKVCTGTRAEMLELERRLTETMPGPLNHERWAGARFGEHP